MKNETFSTQKLIFSSILNENDHDLSNFQMEGQGH